MSSTDDQFGGLWITRQAMWRLFDANQAGEKPIHSVRVYASVGRNPPRQERRTERLANHQQAGRVHSEPPPSGKQAPGAGPHRWRLRTRPEPRLDSMRKRRPWLSMRNAAVAADGFLRRAVWPAARRALGPLGPASAVSRDASRTMALQAGARGQAPRGVGIDHRGSCRRMASAPRQRRRNRSWARATRMAGLAGRSGAGRNRLGRGSKASGEPRAAGLSQGGLPPAAAQA